jgi:mycobactin lysine-N-oxygenase
MNDLAIIGAGPKAGAVCARLASLALSGKLAYRAIPFSCVVIETNNWAANWDGRHGHTRADSILATPPDRDVGFPYEEGDPATRDRLWRYSWRHYLADTQMLRGWLERGQPHPTVSEFAQYIEWVGQSCVNDVIHHPQLQLDVRLGERVQHRKVSWANGEWRIDLPHNPVNARHLMLTGPGLPRRLPILKSQNQHTRVWTPEELFSRQSRIRLKRTRPVAIVGGGGSAAEIALFLHDTHRGMEVYIVGLDVTLWSRGDSVFEWQIGANQVEWQQLGDNEKAAYRTRFSMGAIPPLAMERLGQLKTVHYVRSNVDMLNRVGQPDSVQLLNNNVPIPMPPVQAVFMAAGYQQAGVLSVLNKEARDALANRLHLQAHYSDTEILSEVQEGGGTPAQLSISMDDPTTSTLIWPAASAWAIAPAYADLTLLGEMGKVVLDPIV